MRISTFLAIAAAVSLSAPVAAQTAQVAKSTQTAGSKQETSKDSDKKECRKVAATGSRMGERVCLTKDQWKKVEEQVDG